MNRPDKLLQRFFLARYRHMGPLPFQKARIQLWLLLVSTALLPLYLIQDYVSDGDFEPTLAVPVTGGIIVMLGLTFVLRTGRYLLSAHLFLLLCFSLIWHDMFFWPTSSSSPLLRLDTIVLLLCILLMVPLLTNQSGLLTHFAINFLILIVFVRNNPETAKLTPGELRAYASDAIVSFMLTGIVALLLVRTAARTRRRLERANVNLEEKARHRTRALRQATEQLRLSRDEMRKDLMMARHVQQNMILTAPPAARDWEIALSFRPLAQVSGDFYDFYTEGDLLRGVSLFDVSGHGVASGLITILARSVVYRHYEQSGFSDPGRILQEANEELIGELKNTNHYISGILLRMNGGDVEYANAGHSDLLLSRAGGETGPARDDEERRNEAARGNLMGIADLRDRYPIAHCKVFPGDALLLYSDGITEAVNEDLEPFGFDRLKAAFHASAGAGDASVRLSHLMAEHGQFMGKRPCEDDLTVLLLVKK